MSGKDGAMRIRTLALGLAGCAALAACDVPLQAPPDSAQCTRLFEEYDYLVNTFPPDKYSASSDTYILYPALGKQNIRLISAGCVTNTDDLDGLEQLGAKLGFRKPVDSGAAIKPTAIHVGVLTSLTDVSRATVFFRNLGYKTRTIGAEGLGRRLYIGPVASEGAMRDAMDIARQAGFIAPYPSTIYRFWGY